MIFLVLLLLVWLFWLERRFAKLCEKIDYDIEMIYDKLEQKQYEKRKWDFEEEDRKQEEEMRIDVESMRFSDKIEKERKEKEKKKQDDCWEINKQ